MKIKCDVFRLDPDSGEKGKYITYHLDAEPTETALDVLMKIYKNFDSSLSFRFACGVVKCGECALMVNGVPCLACDRLVEAEMKIDPLPNLPLIKDLVIDRRAVFDEIFKRLPRLSEIDRAKDRLHCSDEKTIDNCIQSSVQLTKCFECLMCQSSCPVFADDKDVFIGPLGLLWLAQMRMNPANAPVPSADVQSALDMCLRCGICSDACPCSEDILNVAFESLDNE